MCDYTKKLKTLGMKAPTILIPKKQYDYRKWAVVACDQYTSDPEYWQSVEDIVQDAPSTLRLIYPECYLEEADPNKRIADINAAMRSYITEGIFDEYEDSMFLVYRETRPGTGRWGLVTALDLEQYDYSADSTSLIRATEGTIIDRIPPRKRIRKDALLEFPHILVLIDDDKRSIIEPLAAKKDQLKKVYDVELMKDSGRVQAYAVSDRNDLSALADALESLADPSRFSQRYGSEDVLLYAMGDGNHSLATAKSCWEDLKKDLSESEQADHPARFALVEIENIFDEGLLFEPIHRVLFQADIDEVMNSVASYCSSWSAVSVSDLDSMQRMINSQDEYQYFGYVSSEEGLKVIRMKGATSNLAAGTLQSAFDQYLTEHGSASIDYTHGMQVTYDLGSQKGNIGVFLPEVKKDEFFESIVSDGALPRKTFSMGEDFEKRFYIEGRKITV